MRCATWVSFRGPFGGLVTVPPLTAAGGAQAAKEHGVARGVAVGGACTLGRRLHARMDLTPVTVPPLTTGGSSGGGGGRATGGGCCCAFGRPGAGLCTCLLTSISEGLPASHGPDAVQCQYWPQGAPVAGESQFICVALTTQKFKVQQTTKLAKIIRASAKCLDCSPADMVMTVWNSEGRTSQYTIGDGGVTVGEACITAASRVEVLQQRSLVGHTHTCVPA